jgi:hypothetical protein
VFHGAIVDAVVEDWLPPSFPGLLRPGQPFLPRLDAIAKEQSSLDGSTSRSTAPRTTPNTGEVRRRPVGCAQARTGAPGEVDSGGTRRPAGRRPRLRRTSS